ncbi:serine hydrolase domain-containing protein [Cellvibrio sp. OA-2007]|uniref:serine hydrolase domain-containing protein n=1 Tax=Cellvibrio sp. OA-2007 TaxID=529823 RepID=UPI0007813CF7|nr:serine hydrolase [Cellvibrio sp. OA-2007]
MRFLTALLSIIITCSSLAHADADTPPQTLEELKTAIEKIRTETNTPAVGIALVNKDGPLWMAGLGEANIAQHTPADENTLFRIGSVSKMFAALAVLKLQEEGKLNLNDKVRDLVPEIQFENQWEETHPVRIAHLLEHTTGWDDIHLAEYAYSAPDSMSTKEGLDYHPDSRKSRWIPGTRHAYCNSGSAVVAYIVEKISGKKYEDYIAETFFKPLDMPSTSYFQTELYKQKGATLYTNGKPENYWHIIHRAAGSINSSPKDMANFMQFLLQRGATQNQQLIPRAAFDRMEIPTTTLGSTAQLTGGYGLANYTSGYKDFNMAFHGHNGGVFGGLTELSYNQQLETGYVFMINAGNGQAFDKISKTIRAYLLKNHQINKPQPIVLPEKFKALNGYYVPINDRQQLTRFMNRVFGVMKFHTDDTYLYRQPLLGGWDAPSKDFAINDDYLIDQWTGLPSIALVNDPIAGNSVQASTDLFKPVSAFSVFSLLGLYVSLGTISLLSLLAIIVWGCRRLAKKIPAEASVWIRIWPLLTSVVLLGSIMSLSMVGLFMQAAASVSLLSITVYLLSIAYPLCALASAFVLIKYRNQVISRWIYGYALIYTGLHLLMAAHLVYYGIFALKLWA